MKGQRKRQDYKDRVQRILQGIQAQPPPAPVLPTIREEPTEWMTAFIREVRETILGNPCDDWELPLYEALLAALDSLQSAGDPNLPDPCIAFVEDHAVFRPCVSAHVYFLGVLYVHMQFIISILCNYL